MSKIIKRAEGQEINKNEIGVELFNNWLLYIKDSSPKTQETYKRAIRQFLYYLIDNDIKKPKREDIIAYREKISGTKKPTTVNIYLMVVKQFFKWTALYDIYPNIAVNVKSFKLDSGFKKDYLTSNQVCKMLDTINRKTFKGLRDYAILSLMVTTGLRTIEVIRANVEDLRNIAEFTALFVQGKGSLEKTNYVKIEQPIEDAIRLYLTARGTVTSTEPLFVSIANRNKGCRMTTRSISRIVKQNMLAAGLNSDRLTAHSLRHTTATLNLLNGGTPEETMQLLRHANLNTTLIYSHALERINNKSEARITKAIFG